MLFKDIIGQEKIKDQLINNFNNNRISHAQLFVESEGGGALGMALAYARYINCSGRLPKDSCGTCPSCLKFNKLAHPDLHIFFPTASNKDNKDVSSKTYISQFREIVLESHYLTLAKWYDHIGIERKHAIINATDCNEIIRLTGIRTYESDYRIFIVWMSEKLQYNAAPKLLKVIEEPPDNTFFIFIAHDPELLPETIMSRLQHLNFPLLGNNEIKKALIEKYDCNEEVARDISFQASGNFIEALNQINLEKPEGTFFLLRDWLRACYSNKPKHIFSNVDAIASFGREKQKAFLNYGLKILDQCLLINYEATKPLKVFEEELEFLLKFSNVVNNVNIVPVTKCFNEAISHISRNANSKIVFADLSFKLHKLFKKAQND